MRSEFLKFTNDSLRKSKVAFIIWDTYTNGNKADPQMVDLCLSLIEVHLYFMIDGKSDKVNLFKSGHQTFAKIRGLGYSYVLCLHPDTLIKCEGAVEELLAQVHRDPHRGGYGYKKGHKLFGTILLNLEQCEPSEIDGYLKTNSVCSLVEKYVCSVADNSQREIHSSRADLAAGATQLVIVQEDTALKKHLQEGFNVCFAFNTESYDDIEKFEGLLSAEHVVGFASGFKLNRIAWKSRETCLKLTFVDLNENALTFKKRMYTEWDGFDLPAWFQANFAGQPFFYEKTESHFQASWQRELSLWGGQKNFAEHWSWFRNLPVTFERINFLLEPGKLRFILQQTESSLLWYSNLWNNEYVAHLYGVKQLASAQLQWLEKAIPEDLSVTLFQDPIRVGPKKIYLSGQPSIEAIKRLNESLSGF